MYLYSKPDFQISHHCYHKFNCKHTSPLIRVMFQIICTKDGGWVGVGVDQSGVKIKPHFYCVHSL